MAQTVPDPATEFLEDYVLSVDRVKEVEKVYDDDTVEYWYYTILNAQNKGESKEVDELFNKADQNGYGDNEDLMQLAFRQSLIEYGDKNYEHVTETLRDQILQDITLDHQQDSSVMDSKATDFPTTLQLSTKKLLEQEFEKISSGEATLLDLFTPASGEFLAHQDLNRRQTVDFLNLMETEPPKISSLTTIIERDLRSGTEFGDRGLHYKLTRDQMEEIAKKMPGSDKVPGILADETFIVQYCKKLRPVTDKSISDDFKALGNYLADLKKFALKKIGKNHASLKAMILFNVMRHQEKAGEGYNKSLLLKYLSITKRRNVYRPKSSVFDSNPAVSVDFDFNVPTIPELEPIVDDEPLVRRAMGHFFLEGDKTEAFVSCVDKTYSLPLFSESYLVKDLGKETFQEAQRGTIEKMGGGMQNLCDKVELELTSRNKKFYKVEEPVELEFVVKNTPTIEVNVYEVNSRNYYITKQNEIPLDLNLTGSTPISTFSLQFHHPPIRRILHTQEIKALAGKRGVFIVDLIGNGMTTRALIRKGELRFIADLEKEKANGYVFKVFNEKNEAVKRARIWMDSKDYLSDENGSVSIPFADEEKDAELIILEDLDSFGSATLQMFDRETPRYKLVCGMYIDREQILRKKQAKVIIRPNLYMNDEIVGLENLKNIQFKLTMDDNQGNKRTRIAPLVLVDDKETVFTFTVPTELRMITCLLTCTIAGRNLMSKQVFGVNAADDTTAIANMYLFPSGEAGYVLSVQGKNGEGYPNKVVKLHFTHRYLKNKVEATVQTDENGRVYLGRLPDVELVDAVCDDPIVYSDASFDVLTDLVNVPAEINKAAGSEVHIPFTPHDPKKPPVIHLFDANYIENFNGCLEFKEGYIHIKGLPSGDFVCYIRDFYQYKVTIRVSDGAKLTNKLGDYVIGANRVLQLSEEWPLNVVSATGNRKKGYKIKLKGFNKLTRVHIAVLSQTPAFNIFGFLCSPSCPPDVIQFTSPQSKYLDARPLDSEYNYVIERTRAVKTVGNMLMLPSMLTNGWTPDKLARRVRDPLEFTASPLRADEMTQMKRSGMMNAGAAHKNRESASSNLEFLGEGSWVYPNRKVDENGEFELEADFISDQHTLIQVLAVDDDNTALVNIKLNESEQSTKNTDVRLSGALAMDQHFSEKRRVVCLPNKSDTYMVKDFSTAEYEPYESLEEPFNLYRHLAGQASETMKDAFLSFLPLTEWHELSMKEKLSFYDGHACHEVNLFLYRKDKTFFESVVVPLLKEKIQKTFMDLYFLGADLKMFTDSQRYFRLNTLEQILLAERLGDAKFTEKTLRAIAEKSKYDPLDPREMDQIFDAAIDSRQLGVDELEQKQDLVEQEILVGQHVRNREKKEEYLKEGEIETYVSSTVEYQEAGYFQVPLTNQRADLICPTRFWNDFAKFVLDPQSKADGFLSTWFMYAYNNINEMLLSLAVLDVPLSADEPKRLYLDGNAVKVLAKTPVILFIRELIQTDVRTSAIAVSTNYFDANEPTHQVSGETVDKFVDENFQTHRVYGCRVVVTNVSRVEQRVEILCQIPEGSVQCGTECFQTQSWFQTVEPFGTYRREYFFYFPEPGTYNHFPVHVNKNAETVGFGKDIKKLIVEALVQPSDKSSWRYISQVGTEEEVLAFLAESPQASSVDLSKMCWRFVNNDEFFDKVVDVLRKRQIFDPRVWAYSLVCDKGRGTATLGEFLQQNTDFQEFVGPAFKSSLCTLDPESSRAYQITEFWPLKNPRAHDKIVAFFSDGFRESYAEFLNTIAFKTSDVKEIPLSDKLTLCNCLLGSNRIEKARALFDIIDPSVARESCPMVYDYLSIYLSFFEGKVDEVESIANQYANSELPFSIKHKWTDVLEQILHKSNPSLSDKMFLKKQEEEKRKALEPALDFEPQTDATLLITYRNVDKVTINFYRTELELMFSEHPFQDQNVSYKLMMPNKSQVVELAAKKNSTVVKLPEDLRDTNTIVEMISGDIKVTKVSYDHDLVVQVSSATGQLRVLSKKTNKPLPRAYCKVYAQSMSDHKKKFYKDGYTDVLGRFDFRTLSTDALQSSRRLGVLVSTEDHGSVIREIDVPSDFQTRSYGSKRRSVF